jgi:hypothetical protein
VCGPFACAHLTSRAAARRERVPRGAVVHKTPHLAHHRHPAQRVLRHPQGRHWRARRRHRQERRALGVGLERRTLISFDRRKCKGPLAGPNATGNHCPEGFAYYKYPGPAFESFENGSAEASYYTWVDQHNTVGLGENVPISTANLNDGFAALNDGQMVMLRIPYPLGFFAKGLDGRIDDPNAGWKGRGLWSTNGDRTPWLKEGGKGSKPRAVQIQVRPDPLAH